jgi:hypothetical protein
MFEFGSSAAVVIVAALFAVVVILGFARALSKD